MNLPKWLYEYKGSVYPEWIRDGNAVGAVQHFASMLCTGHGLDIGGTRDWILQGAIGVNPYEFDPQHDAYNLPGKDYDFIFSSHCLEHLENPIEALELWRDSLKSEGVMFLYVPHPDMEYWLPQNNRRHLHQWTPEAMAKILGDLGLRHVFASGRDLYWSFAVIGWKE